MIEIIPGILEQEFSEIKRKIRLVEAYVSWIQIDVLDGSLFNNTCFNDPSPFASLSTTAYLEAHLMVKKPIEWVEKFNLPQFKRYIAHWEGFALSESTKTRFNLVLTTRLNLVRKFITHVKSLNKEVALAVDLPTKVEVLFPFLDQLDQVLIMTINTGRSGQAFSKEALEKIKKVRKANPDIPIEVDGGINKDTAPLAVSAGATRLTATSSIFGTKDIKKAIEELASSV